MNKLLMISRDGAMLDTTSAVFARTKEIATHFSELHVVVLGRSQSKAHIISKNLFVYNTASKFFVASFFKSVWKSFRIAKKFTLSDFVTTQDPFEAGIIGFFVSKFYTLTLELQLHTDCFAHFFAKSLVNKARIIIFKAIASQASYFRVVSMSIKQNLVQHLRIDESKIRVLPIFVDVPQIRASEGKLNKSNFGPKIVLVVARLEKEKNVHLAIEAFGRVARKFPEAVLLVVGQGREKDELTDFVRFLNLQDRVRFLGWQQDVYSFYRIADVLLVTSLYEGFGMNIIEALALGCSVVSTPVGIAEEAGAIITSYDPGDIASKISNILEHPIPAILPSQFIMTKEDHVKRWLAPFGDKK